MKFVVIDLEMCKVPNSGINRDYKWDMEIIQIGAVLVDEKYEIIDKFNSYVKPQEGNISGFIKELTGISRYNVKNAPSFAEVIESFKGWLSAESEIRFVSWSMSDRKQLIKEATYKHVDLGIVEDWFEDWIDAQAMFGEKMDTDKCYKLEDALFVSDVDPEGNMHDGLDDAYNTAKLFIKLETEPDFKLNDMYLEAKEGDVEHLSFAMGDLFAGVQLG